MNGALDFEFNFENVEIAAFQDLLPIDLNENNEESESDDDEAPSYPIMKAIDLNAKDLAMELERRKMNPKGFFDEDCRLLQVELDREHELYMIKKQKEANEARKVKALQRLENQRRRWTEITLREEKSRLKSNKRLQEWFYLIQKGLSPLKCKVPVDEISGRTLGRLLFDDKRVVCLNVSSCCLGDKSGVFIARALRKNRTIRNLDLGQNNLGFETCKVLAESLKENETLEYLSLESNPLYKIEKLLAEIVTTNKSLKHFSLFKCSLTVEGGKLIAKAMAENSSLLCLEYGSNSFSPLDCSTIDSYLKINRENHIQQLKMQEELEIKMELERLQKMKETEELEQAKLDTEWLTKQKDERAEERRIEMEKVLETERLQQIEEEKRILEQRIKEEEKAKKKKNKKKKKKGK
ncbi:hypothetical protein CTEN210_05563 [Chaetoceros tenuissimus]|uniref:Uncharacterized protein n=1 Tax=Chaetoceros tenuissimus TaxID=426638 RepID=A0AAD3CNF0_9STRA|nr:hypothetical protein CTEN210_05563 [Chaetoceros tenuissimus]